MDSLTYRVDCAPVDEVARHLSGCSADFTPSLDSRVDVNSYATKLRATARTFEAWANQLGIPLGDTADLDRQAQEAAIAAEAERAAEGR